jgi:hypothetical protein
MFNTAQYQIIGLKSLYKWHKNYGNIQKRYFKSDFKIRREKQIEDFVKLNGYNKVKIEKDNYILGALVSKEVQDLTDADLCIITDQRLEHCPSLYLCLNRYYINIDNSFHDESLPNNPNQAITEWIKSNLNKHRVVDLSLDYDDDGSWFTWVIPDRHYLIERK